MARPGFVNYKIQIGDEIIELEAPEGLSDQQLEAMVVEDLPELVGGSVGAPAPEEAPESSAVGAFARGLPREATFNFNDEIAALGNAAGLAGIDNLTGMGNDQQAFWNNPEGFWAAFENNLAKLNAQQNADDVQHPVASAAGKIGGVLSTLPRAGMAVASRLPQAVRSAAAARPILTTSTLGGVAGAASGYGAGEGDTRGQSSAIGGLAGFGLGPAGYAVSEMLPIIGRYAATFFGKGNDKEAVRQIVKAMERDGYPVQTAEGINTLRQALQEYTGKPVSLADLGGALRSRAGVGLRTPGAAQQSAIDSVQQRQAGQTQRLAGDIRANVAPRTDVHALNEALVEQRRTAAQPLRDAALFEDVPVQPTLPPATVAEGPNEGLRRTLGMSNEAPVPVEPPLPVSPSGRQSRVLDPTRETDPERYQTMVELQNLARLPDAQSALKAAKERVESERALLAVKGEDTSHLPDFGDMSNLDVRAFDYLKRYLDDEVSALYRRGQGSTFSAGEAAQVRELRDAIRERLRVAVPEYGDYLDQYAGSSEMIDALEVGQQFGKFSPEQIAAEQSRRSSAAQELYRVGAARSMLDDVMSTRDGRNPASRIMNSEEARAQLAATGVDPINAASLNRAVQQERTLNLLPQELAGSQTAQRQLAQTDAGDFIPTNIANPYGFGGRFLQRIADTAALRRTEGVNNEILPRLTSTDPAVIETTIKELEREGQWIAAQTLRRRAAEIRNAGLGGVMIGGPVALEDR